MHGTTKSYLVNAPGQTKEVGMIEREETSKEQIDRRTREAHAEGSSEHGNDVEDFSRVERGPSDEANVAPMETPAAHYAELRYRWPE